MGVRSSSPAPPPPVAPRLPIIWTENWSDENIEVLRELLNKGADLNQRNVENNLSPLCHSVKNGYVQCAKLIVNHSGLDPNAIKTVEIERVRDEGGMERNRERSPLHLAAEAPTHALELCQLLISHGADLHVMAGSNRVTPLTYACRSNAPPEVIRCLMSTESLQIHRQNTGPLFVAAACNNAEALRLMLSYRDVRHRFPHWNALGQQAVHSCDLSVLQVVADLLPESIFNTDSGHRLLYHAIPPRRLNPAKVKLLLDRGCKAIHVYGDSHVTVCALREACVRIGDDDLFQAVLDTVTPKQVAQYNARKSDNFESLVVSVIARGRHSVAERLLKLLQMGFDIGLKAVANSPPFSSGASQSEDTIGGGDRQRRTIFGGGGGWRRAMFGGDDRRALFGGGGWHRAIFGGGNQRPSAAVVSDDGIICDCILTCGELSRIVAAVPILIQHGAGVNATGNGIAPLTAVVLRQGYRPNELWQQCNVFELLISAGANVEYRHEESPFPGPDVMLASVVTGSEWVLRRTLERNSAGISAATAFINDLLRFNVGAFCTKNSLFQVRSLLQEQEVSRVAQLAARVIRLRNNVAVAALTALEFSLKTDTLCRLCAELRDKFGVETVCRAVAEFLRRPGLSYELAILRNHPGVQSELVTLVRNHPDYDAGWQMFQAAVVAIDPLKHMCRIRIRTVLSSNTHDLSHKVALMQLPGSLQKYLLHDLDV